MLETTHQLRKSSKSNSRALPSLLPPLSLSPICLSSTNNCEFSLLFSYAQVHRKTGKCRGLTICQGTKIKKRAFLLSTVQLSLSRFSRSSLGSSLPSGWKFPQEISLRKKGGKNRNQAFNHSIQSHDGQLNCFATYATLAATASSSFFPSSTDTRICYSGRHALCHGGTHIPGTCARIPVRTAGLFIFAGSRIHMLPFLQSHAHHHSHHTAGD